MPTEHGALLAGNRVYLSREDVAQIEAEARAALRAELREKVRRLLDDDIDSDWDKGYLAAARTVLTFLTDGAEPPAGAKP